MRVGPCACKTTRASRRCRRDSLGVEAVPYVFVVNGGEGTADAFICGVTSVERLQRTLHRCAPDGCPPDADFGI